MIETEAATVAHEGYVGNRAHAIDIGQERL